MFSRKFSNTIRRKKRLIISTVIALIIFLGIGYSFFYSDFAISGSLTVSGYLEPTLYNVLKKEALTGGLATEYTGSHGDSMDSSLSTEKIYHWYASNDTEGTQVQNKNNVIFAGQCWQMIRTTDTGGVKMIYNGEAENNKCLDTRGNHVGYDSRTSQSLNSNYWYGTDYTYDSINQVFSIAGTTEQTTWSESNSTGLIGKYTCRGTNETDTCATLYLVESYYNTTSGYVIPLNSNSHYSQFGRLQFNVNYNSLADVGYMYNKRYTTYDKTMYDTENILSSSTLGTTYWYANSVTWGTPTSDRYNLDNPYQVSSEAEYPNLVGKYTFSNSNQAYTQSYVHFIVAVNNNAYYYFTLGNSVNHTLADSNYTYTYGDSYHDNGNGTYTILNQDETNPVTIERKNWFTNYSNVGAGKYVCKNAVDDTCSELWYTTATSNTSMRYINVANNYKYAKSFEYKLDPDDNTYKYFLDDDTSTTFWNINDSTNKTIVNNAHYTCWNEDGKCTTLSYIIYISGIIPTYIKLTNGISVETVVNEMLYNNDVNQINSTIKNGVDSWYKKYIYQYDNMIEDTIFCNDRSLRNADTNGWNPNGGSVSNYIYFKANNINTTDLNCTNTTDKFSVSNSLAHLTYKVGFISSPEMHLLNSDNALKVGSNYWLISPSYYSQSMADGRYVNYNGTILGNDFHSSMGVRPSVSLTPGTEYTSGDGSMANPYVVKMS